MCALRGQRDQQAKALTKSNHSRMLGTHPSSSSWKAHSRPPFTTDFAFYKFQILNLTLVPIIHLLNMYAMEAYIQFDLKLYHDILKAYMYKHI